MSQLYAIAAAVLWESGDAHIALSAAFAALAKAAAPVAVAALWQGAAVALGMALFLRFAPRVTAAHRFAAWAVGFVVVAGLPFLPMFSHVTASAAPISAASYCVSAAPRPWFELDSRWALAIAGLWFLAAMCRFVQLAFHSMRLRKLWKSATPIEHNDLAESLAGLLPEGGTIRICTTRELDRPSVIGFLAPRVLIPEWLFERLAPRELEQVVLHEAEHLRRRDDWTNLLQKFCLVLFPLNPALAWMERRLCREREMACDEGVIERTRAPRAYAACLTSLAERGLQRDLQRRAGALSLAAWRRRPELVHRVHSILRRKQALHPVAARALLGVAGCSLLLGSVEMARCPQMVAFVAAPKPVAIAKLQPGPALAADVPQAANGFRAIEAKAVLPSDATPSATVEDAPSYHAAQSTQSVATIDGGSHEQLIKATMPSEPVATADRDSERNSGAAYIVLTTWEQMGSAPHHRSRAIADYDTGSDEQAQPDNGPSADSSGQIVVTRLVFKVYPAGQIPSSTPSKTSTSKTENASDSKSGQQVALPLDGGWLVFQL